MMRKINGFDNYGITSCGKVYNYKTQKWLNGWVNDCGYRVVELNGKQKFIHRLVAEAYLPNFDNLSDVDHIDGNKTHNYLGNLQWMTRADNVRKQNNKPVRCVETGQVFESRSAAANFVGKHKQGISNCLTGKAKTCGGYHWEEC